VYVYYILYIIWVYINSTSPPVDLIDSTTAAAVFVFEFAVNPEGPTNTVEVYLYTFGSVVAIIYRRDSTC